MNTHLNINQKNKINLCSEQPYFTVAHIHQCLSTNHCDQVLPVYTVVMSAPDEEKEFFFSLQHTVLIKTLYDPHFTPIKSTQDVNQLI